MTIPRPTIDPPACIDLMQLVADFLAKDLAPNQSDAKLRYRTLVAANLLRIALRELAGIEEFAMDADGNAIPPELKAGAGSLRGFAEDLAEERRIITDSATFDLAMRYVEAKLKVAAPEVLTQRIDDGTPT